MQKLGPGEYKERYPGTNVLILTEYDSKRLNRAVKALERIADALSDISTRDCGRLDRSARSAGGGDES